VLSFVIRHSSRPVPHQVILDEVPVDVLAEAGPCGIGTLPSLSTGSITSSAGLLRVEIDVRVEQALLVHLAGNAHRAENLQVGRAAAMDLAAHVE